MLVKTAFVAARDRRRLATIVAVLITYGFDKIIDRLGLRAIARVVAWRTRQVDVTRLTRPQRVRKAIEALGPTFVKLGQILAARPDLLSPQWTEELSKLHSGVKPLPWETMRPLIEAELGGAPADIFAEFDTTPIASASMAQVYKARLETGEDVVVKVLRPGLQKVIEADLRLMGHGSRIVEKEWKELARYRPQEQMRHLAQALAGELDLANEGRNCELLASLFEGRDDVVFPKIHWEYTTEKVMVQEFIHGIFLTDQDKLEAAGLDRVVLAQRGTDVFLQMALVEGTFHADPHPGNILALPGNRIAMIDFGAIGRLTQKRRNQLLMLIGSMLNQDSDGLMAVLLDWSGTSSPDLTRLEASAQAFVHQHSGKSLNLGLVLTDFMSMARENDLAMPTDLAILFKSLVLADGVMRQLDPNFDLFRAAGPTVQSTLQSQFSVKGIRSKIEAIGAGLFGAASELPTLIHLLLVRLKQGKVTVEIEVKGLDRLTRTLERAAARLAIGLVVAAFTVTLAPKLFALGNSVVIGVTILLCLIGVGWFTLLGRNKMH
ncbi:AarF/ABC1/UbiB kinase family protein [Lichenihabitans sp. Uapishka_5]|uniref:ABC1 kinase family protein n=1 Tax=Lichenihabitans sp. Uapishka_5 TaxID=3037302 RepID=UPI0029E81DA7|nr:AarF/ABC1/UbiB kinase family protein [Lichenihabitans sp. Uapishka_5]MDX7951052.1 AarF/ABC1/UbiB kinase family protein [Lichenihabitans sp. Uapishka_5]